MINLPDVLLQIPLSSQVVNEAIRLGTWIGFNQKKNEYTFYKNMPNLAEEKGHNNTEYISSNSSDLDPYYKYYIKFRDLLKNPDFDSFIYNPKLGLILYKCESTSIPLQTTDPNQLSLF